jgi:hypothetical protein
MRYDSISKTPHTWNTRKRRMVERIYRSTFSWSRHWWVSSPGRFTCGGVPGTHWVEGWVGPRTGLDAVEKRTISPLPWLELRPLGRPALSKSLYRLDYRGFLSASGLNQIHWVFLRERSDVKSRTMHNSIERFCCIVTILSSYSEEKRGQRFEQTTILYIQGPFCINNCPDCIRPGKYTYWI